MILQKPFPGSIEVGIALFLGCTALGYLPASDSNHGIKMIRYSVYASASDSANFVMCKLIPGSEVAGYSPFNGGFIKSEPWPTVHILQGCSYEFDNTDKNDAASICIGVTDFATAKDAMSSLRNWEKMARDNELDLETVDSLGDKASTSGDDEVGLNVAIGNRMLTVNLRGQFPKVTATQKKNAAKALARLVLTRLKLK